MISIVSLILVLVRPIVLLFFRLGNAICFRCPLPEIDQLATLGTKRTIRVGWVPGDNLATPGTINNRWFHNHSLEKQNGRGLRPVTATPLLIQTAVIGAPNRFPPVSRCYPDYLAYFAADQVWPDCAAENE